MEAPAELADIGEKEDTLEQQEQAYAAEMQELRRKACELARTYCTVNGYECPPRIASGEAYSWDMTKALAEWQGSDSEELREFARLIDNIIGLRDVFLEKNIGLIPHMLKSVQKSADPCDDEYESAVMYNGFLALRRACEKYDGRGRFSTLACFSIARAIRQVFRLGLPNVVGSRKTELVIGTKSIRAQEVKISSMDEFSVERARGRNISLLSHVVNARHGGGAEEKMQLGTFLNDPATVEGADRGVERFTDRTMDDVVAYLEEVIPDPRDRFVFCMRRGAFTILHRVGVLTPDQRQRFDEEYAQTEEPILTLEAIGRIFGVTKERVRQLEVRAERQFSR